jgi:hypothetical protein
MFGSKHGVHESRFRAGMLVYIFCGHLLDMCATGLGSGGRYYDSESTAYLLSKFAWIAYMAGFVIISSADLDVNAYFKHNRLLTGVFVGTEVVHDALISCMNYGDNYLHAFWLPCIPFVYVMLRFDSVVGMKATYRPITDWWMVHALLSVVASVIRNTSPTRRMESTHPLYYVLQQTAVLLLAVLMIVVDRWAKAIGESPTVQLHLFMYTYIFTGSLQIILLKANRTPMNQFTAVDWATGPVLFAISMIAALMVALRFRQEAKERRNKQRIFRQCLVKRPPLAFPLSEFMEMWNSYVAEKKQQQVEDAVMEAVEWCLDRPARFWPYLDENVFRLPIWNQAHLFARLQRAAAAKKKGFEARIIPVMEELREQDKQSGGHVFELMESIEAEVKLEALGDTVTSMLNSKPDLAFKQYLDETVLPGMLAHFAESAFESFSDALQRALPSAVVEDTDNRRNSGGLKELIQIRLSRDRCIKHPTRMKAKVQGYRRDYLSAAGLAGLAGGSAEHEWGDQFPFASRIGDVLRTSVTVSNAQGLEYVWRQLHKVSGLLIEVVLWIHQVSGLQVKPV